jgi:hypothetical protein
MTDKVYKSSNSKCYAPWSELFTFCLDVDYKHMAPGVEQVGVQTDSEQVML